MRLNNRHIIVTGGAQGIGLACALRFASEGAKVLVVDKQEAPDLDRASEDLAKADGESKRLVNMEPDPYQVASNIEWLQADVADRSTAKAALAMGIRLWGRVDGLLNNAGIIHGCHFLELKDEDFDRVLNVNLRSYFIFSQVIAMHMVAEGVKSTRAICDLAEREGIDLPIAEMVAAVLYDGRNAVEMTMELLGRPTSTEFAGIEQSP